MNVCARTIASLAIAAFAVQPCLLGAQSTATKTPVASRIDLFLGYTHFGSGKNFTTGVEGNRMVGLNGGSAALDMHLTRRLGLVADFGGYDDSQLQLTGTGANQPRTVNSSGTAFTYMFGPRFDLFHANRVSIFAQVLAGGVHASAVTVSDCAGASCAPLPVQSAFALTAGGGLDLRLTRHLTLRAVQAEYMMTRFAPVPSAGSSNSSQNDIRLSSGLDFRFGGHITSAPLQLACNIQPESVFAGADLIATASPANLNPKHPGDFHWTTNGGTISGSGSSIHIRTKDLAPGAYVASASIAQGPHPWAQASCTANFTVRSPEPPTISCSASPSTISSGDTVTIATQALSPQNRPLTYSYTTSAGEITGQQATASLTTPGVAPGMITISCTAVDDLGKSASANTTITVMAAEPPPTAVAVPQTRNLCAISFARDRKRPVRVDNEAKACLDDIALQMQHESSGELVLLGSYSPDEKPTAATERARNASRYLTEEKGIDAQRVEVRSGSYGDRTVVTIFVPTGATYHQP